MFKLPGKTAEYVKYGNGNDYVMVQLPMRQLKA